MDRTEDLDISIVSAERMNGANRVNEANGAENLGIEMVGINRSNKVKDPDIGIVDINKVNKVEDP